MICLGTVSLRYFTVSLHRPTTSAFANYFIPRPDEQPEAPLTIAPHWQR
jgi:hypothetical protein